MNRKIPPDAFDFYYALGQARTYDEVAGRYKASRRAIAKRAAEEGWKQRVKELDATARKRATEKLLETAEEMNTRHLKVLRYIQSKSIEALKSLPLESAMDGVRAYATALGQERLIRGEPTDRTATQVEEIIKREYERWQPRGEDEWDEPAETSESAETDEADEASESDEPNDPAEPSDRDGDGETA